jgi:hypothetical protein
MPMDWWCMAQTNQAWYYKLRTILSRKQKRFFQRVQDFHKEHKLSETKDILCVTPYYYDFCKSGCIGRVEKWTCLRHKMLSIYQADLCHKCLSEPVSKLCYGKYCDKLSSRDYVLLLRKGKAVRAKGYPCRIADCKNLSDYPKGYCHRHALECVKKFKKEPDKKVCKAKTQAGRSCNCTSNSSTQKCYQHRYKLVQ